MLTSSKKSKGRRLQQYVRDKLREKQYSVSEGYGEYDRFYLEEDDVRSTSMGASGVDVQLSPKAQSVIPLDIETKNTETASPWAWMKQAKANTKEGRMPCVVFTRNREGDVYAMVRFEDLVKLL